VAVKVLELVVAASPQGVEYLGRDGTDARLLGLQSPHDYLPKVVPPEQHTPTLAIIGDHMAYRLHDGSREFHGSVFEMLHDHIGWLKQSAHLENAHRLRDCPVRR